MINRLSRALGGLIAGACLILGSAHAQTPPELLLPLEQQEIGELMNKSNYGLRGQLYFAKRYRLAKINFDVLAQPNATFSITPFDDLTLVLSSKDLKGPSSFGNLREWSGELISPSLREVVDSRIPAALRANQRITLWIRSGEHEVPIELIRKMAAENKHQEGGGQAAALPNIDGAPRETANARVFTKLDLQTVSGEWFVPAKAARIVIRPVEDDPRYHLIYEQDETKMPQGGDSVRPETSERLRSYSRFREGLELERSRELAESPR